MAKTIQSQKRRAEIVKTKPVNWRDPVSGKSIHAGTKCKDSDGNVFVLLTPAGKTAKAAEELRRGVRLTNDLVEKKNEAGKPMKLTKAQRSYRAGVLDQARASANCHKANNGGAK